MMLNGRASVELPPNFSPEPSAVFSQSHGFPQRIPRDVSKQLLSRPGAIDLIPTLFSQDRGEWKILVQRHHISSYFKWLLAELHNITSSLDPNEKPANLPAYAICSKHPSLDQPDDDDSEDSYGTAFSNAMSIATTDMGELNFELPTELNRTSSLSYADVVLQSGRHSPRCGYNRSMAKAIRYAPKVYGGAGFRQIYVEQGVGQIML